MRKLNNVHTKKKSVKNTAKIQQIQAMARFLRNFPTSNTELPPCSRCKIAFWQNLDLVATGPIAVRCWWWWCDRETEAQDPVVDASEQISRMMVVVATTDRPGIKTTTTRRASGNNGTQGAAEGWVTRTHTHTNARTREWIIIKSIFNKNLSISIWDLLDECALFRIARRNLQLIWAFALYKIILM